MPEPTPFLAVAFVLGYLLGSVPFGLVLTVLAGNGDLRKLGSGNIGATNVLRAAGKPVAALTVVLDAGKGAAAVALALQWGPDTALMAAYGSVLGHLFPVWLRFSGGKGVATTLGVHLVMAWPVGVACCAAWLLVAGMTRYSSLAALVALALGPAFAWWLTDEPQLIEYTLVIAVIVWARHAGNIRRLLTGTEPKIGRGKQTHTG